MKRIYKTLPPKIIIFSGAGLSAESGISTFRDTNGLWENRSIDEICNEATWKHNYVKVHSFYNQRRTQLATVEPNEAHKTIKRLWDRFGDDLIILTQNVDDMLERTGIPSESITHLHGELTVMHCTACGHKWEIGYNNFNTFSDRCPECDSKKGVKPFIVFFGGRAPKYMDLHNAMKHLYTNGSYLVVIGTQGGIVQIDEMTKYFDKSKKILNNLESSEFINEDNFSEVFLESATTALPKIEEFLIKNFRNSGKFN